MKKNRIVIVVITVIVMLAASFLIGTGFSKRTDVVLGEYAVSEDGTKLIFSAGVSSSMGYTRGFKDEGGGVKPHYLTFYGTFGGLNSDFGAKNEFELELSDTDTEIYFNRPGGGYELVLQKDAATGVWYRPESSTDEPEVMIDGEKPVFETDNISGITLYAVPNHLDGVRVPDEYMDEIVAWIGTFRIERAAGEMLDPGTDTFSFMIEYSDGTTIESGVNTTVIDGVTYYMTSEKEPDCFLEIFEY